MSNMSGVSKIVYHNVLFCLVTKTEQEKLKYNYIRNRINSRERFTIKDILDWCYTQDIYCVTKFFYRKDYPLKANLWNFYSYLRSIFEWRLKKINKKKR